MIIVIIIIIITEPIKVNITQTHLAVQQYCRRLGRLAWCPHLPMESWKTVTIGKIRKTVRRTTAVQVQYKLTSCLAINKKLMVTVYDKATLQYNTVVATR